MRKAIYVIVILFAAGLALRLTLFSPMVLPTDEKLVEQFRRTRPELIGLKALLDSQPTEVVEVGPDGVAKGGLLRGTAAEAGMNSDVYADFKKRMKRAGVSLLYRRNDKVAFSIASRGFASKGYRVFYVFRKTAPEFDTIKSLSDFQRVSRGWATAYRPLDPDWFVKVVW